MVISVLLEDFPNCDISDASKIVMSMVTYFSDLIPLRSSRSEHWAMTREITIRPLRLNSSKTRKRSVARGQLEERLEVELRAERPRPSKLTV